jgi:hypothetical protein
VNNRGVSVDEKTYPLLCRNRGGLIVSIFRRPIEKIINSVNHLPNLEKPRFDYEGANPILAVFEAWGYLYRKFEYATEPLGKGYISWVHLLLSIFFHLFLPIIIVMGVICVIIYSLIFILGIATDFLLKVCLCLCGIIGVILLCYLTYFVVMSLLGKPIRAPIPKFYKK